MIKKKEKIKSTCLKVKKNKRELAKMEKNPKKLIILLIISKKGGKKEENKLPNKLFTYHKLVKDEGKKYIILHLVKYTWTLRLWHSPKWKNRRKKKSKRLYNLLASIKNTKLALREDEMTP